MQDTCLPQFLFLARQLFLLAYHVPRTQRSAHYEDQSHNSACLRLLFLSDFQRKLSTEFWGNFFHYKISRLSVQQEPSSSMRTDRRTDERKLQSIFAIIWGMSLKFVAHKMKASFCSTNFFGTCLITINGSQLH